MEDHRHLTEPRACHFTDILLGPVYAILRQSPVYAILFSQRNHLNFLSGTGAHYSVTLSVQASTATLLYLVNHLHVENHYLPLIYMTHGNDMRFNRPIF